MAIPTSKPITLSTVQGEYGGSSPISMSEYRGKGNAPASGPIDLWGDFNGTSNVVTVNGLIYADQFNDGTINGADVTSSFSAALNNQSSSSYIERVGSLSGGADAFASKQAYVSGIGTILAVRRCVVYANSDTIAGNEYPYAVTTKLIDPSGNTTTYGSAKTLSSFNISENLVSSWGATQAGNWLKDGMRSHFEWFIGDVPPVGRDGARQFWYYVDVDFDYSPA